MKLSMRSVTNAKGCVEFDYLVYWCILIGYWSIGGRKCKPGRRAKTPNL